MPLQSMQTEVSVHSFVINHGLIFRSSGGFFKQTFLLHYAYIRAKCRAPFAAFMWMFHKQTERFTKDMADNVRGLVDLDLRPKP